MALTYLQIQQQIASLQRQAEGLRLAEVNSAIEKTRAIISRFSLTAEQLGLGLVQTVVETVEIEVGHAAGKTRKASKAVKAVKAVKAARVAKAAKVDKSAKPASKATARTTPRIRYRDGANAWGGRGPKPRWLVAGIAAGRTLESFGVAT